ncbi:hypothetical protein BH11PLA1_BH11PLA1_17730 [soil metagenome]
MPVFGSFETISELASSGAVQIFIARRGSAGSAAAPGAGAGESGGRRYAVKFRGALDEITGERDQIGLAEFMAQAAVQKAAGEAAAGLGMRGGAGGWAPVYEANLSEAGAYFATDLYATGDGRPQSLDTLFAVRRLTINDQVLSDAALGMLEALARLHQVAQRGHGNLKPQNVLIDDETPAGGAGASGSGSGGATPQTTGRVMLMDPRAVDRGGETLRDDLPALAGLIYLMVFATPLRRGGVVVLRDEASWKERGVDGKFWRTLTSELLGQGAAALTVEGALQRVQAHRARGAGAGGTRKAEAAGAPGAGAAPGAAGTLAERGAAGGPATVRAEAAGERGVGAETDNAVATSSDDAPPARRPKTLLIAGGVAAGLLVLAGGAYFALRPSGQRGTNQNGPKPIDVSTLSPEETKLFSRLGLLAAERAKDIRDAWKASSNSTLNSLAAAAEKGGPEGLRALDSGLTGLGNSAEAEAASLSAEPELGSLAERISRLRAELARTQAQEGVDPTMGAGRDVYETTVPELAASVAGAPALVKHARGLRERQDAPDAPAPLKAIAQRGLEELAEAARAASAKANGVNEVLGAASVADWTKALVALDQRMAAPSTEWDKGEFAKRAGALAAPSAQGARALAALQRLEQIAADPALRVVANDPRPRWQQAQRDRVADLRVQLDRLTAAGDPEAAAQRASLLKTLDALAPEIAGAGDGVLYQHGAVDDSSRRAALAAQIQTVAGKVNEALLDATVGIKNQFDAAVAPVEQGTTLTAALTAVQVDAKKLSSGAPQDQGDIRRVAKLRTAVQQWSSELDQHSGPPEGVPAWPSEAWQRLVHAAAGSAAASSVSAALATKAATFDRDAAHRELDEWRGAAGKIIKVDAALRTALTGGAQLSTRAQAVSDLWTEMVERNLVTQAQSGAPAERAKTAIDLGLTGLALAEELERLEKSDPATPAGSAALRAAVKQSDAGPGTPAVRVAALEHLLAARSVAGAGASPASGGVTWPAAVNDLDDAVAIVGGARASAGAASAPSSGASPSMLVQRAEAALKGTREALVAQAARSAARTPPDVALLGALASKISAEGPERATLPAWAQLNFALLDLRSAGAGDDAALAARVARVMALKSGAGAGSAALEALDAAVKQTGPTFDPASSGPGAAAKKWTLISPPGQLDTLTYQAPDGATKMSFHRISVPGAPETYLATTEFSIGAAAALLIDAAEAARLKPIAEDSPLRGDNYATGILGWSYDARRGITPNAATGDFQLAKGWMRIPVDERRKVWGSEEFFPPGLDVQPPSAGSPLTRINIVTASALAQVMNCRLPTVDEWRAALTGGSAGGEAAAIQAQVAGAHLRNKSWETWTTHLATVAASRKGAGSTLTAPKRDGAGSSGNAAALVAADGPLLFGDVAVDPNPTFHHLVGNVAEFVWAGPPKAGASAAEMRTNVRLIGGSALSTTPIAELGAPMKVSATEKQTFADVGFRVAFSGGGIEPLFVRVTKALAAVPYVAPPAP